MALDGMEKLASLSIIDKVIPYVCHLSVKLRHIEFEAYSATDNR